jgi:hypothetical protein
MSAGADWQSLRVDNCDVMPLYHQLKPQIREQAKAWSRTP